MNAETFNALYEVGIPVFAYPGFRPEDGADTRLVTRTRSKAEVLGGHTDVVWVEGHSACIALSHVDPVTEAEFASAQRADAVAAKGALPVPTGRLELSELKQVVAEIERFGIYGAAVPATKALVKRADELVTENAKLRARLAAVLDLCDREQRKAMGWENPIPVPEWVAVVQRAALGDDERGAEGAGQLCRCGHGEAYHDAKFNDPQCRLCPEDGERMWRHSFTPAEGGAS